MKYLSVPILCLMLSGCFYQDTPGYIIDESIKLCKDHGDIKEITSYWFGNYVASCKDGVHKTIAIKYVK